MKSADLVATLRAAHALSEHRPDRPSRAPPPADWSTCVPQWIEFPGAESSAIADRAVEVGLDDVLAGACRRSVLDRDALGSVAALTLGITAERRRGASRWYARANPSSGNLHPTELYVLHAGDVLHYDALHHRFVRIARLAAPVAPRFVLTQIAERQCWKYGDRGVRYAELDLGHAVAGLALAASSRGWSLRPAFDPALRTVLGLDGRSVGETLGAVFTIDAPERVAPDGPIDAADPIAAAALTAFDWPGARATARAIEAAVDPASGALRGASVHARRGPREVRTAEPGADLDATSVRGSREGEPGAPSASIDSRADFESTVRARRSAAAFADRAIDRATFEALLSATRADRSPAVFAGAAIDLVVFVHRVEGLRRGAYAYVRTDGGADRLCAALDPEFAFERVGPNLYLLDADDVRPHARLVHGDQDVAADGAFTCTMLAPLDDRLDQRGPSAYRAVHLEAGAIGHVLYLTATARGLGATGIGAFYDSTMREMLGDARGALAPLYGFAVGAI